MKYEYLKKTIMNKFILITLIIFSLPSCTYRRYEAENCFLENDCHVISFVEMTCLNSIFCPKKVKRNGIIHFASFDRSRNPLHGTLGDVGNPPIKCFKNNGVIVTETPCLSLKD